VYIQLKAGALQYTIFISVVIALLVFAFISLTYVQQQLKIKNTHFKEVVHTTNQAFYHSTLQEIPYNSQANTNEVRKDENIKTVVKKNWGLFDIAAITSTLKKEVHTKTALLAAYQQKRTALYLQDESQPLVLVGATKIEGDVYIPKQGAKTGTIAGHSYTNQHLIYGTTNTSKNRLPKPRNLQYLQNFKTALLTSTNDIDLEENSNLVHSFLEPTKIIRSNTTIDVRNVQLTGNIVIQSNTKITVFASSALSDVVLIAPTIVIRENVHGNFQVIASKEIKVAKGCKLKYPTALVLLDKNRTTANNLKETHHILIESGSEVKGIVAFIAENNKENYNTQIRIDEETIVTGEVYCNQNIELKGTVHGSVYTRGFIANAFGSVYKNHIFNGKIISSRLPEQYAGLQFENTKLKTAKWLYY